MKTSKNLKTLKTLSLMDRLILLREVPMFAGLSPEDLERVANIAEEQLYLDQSLLCREGEFGDTLFIITSGKVEVIKTVGKMEKVSLLVRRKQYLPTFSVIPLQRSYFKMATISARCRNSSATRV